MKCTPTLLVAVVLGCLLLLPNARPHEPGQLSQQVDESGSQGATVADTQLQGPSQTSSASQWRGDTVIQSLEVILQVGTQGADVDEPVALDLGVGFPFWLHPLGWTSERAPTFGAVAQRSTASQSTLAAGKNATFQFHLDRPPGSDELDTTRTLLNGLRVSDIQRIGVCSPGRSAWVLEGLEIKLNGISFFSGRGIHKSALRARQETSQRLANRQEASDPMLQALLKSLGGSAEARLATAPDFGEAIRLQRQVAGAYPWYVAPEFTATTPDSGLVNSLQVLVETFDHGLAETRHWAYFSVGGHKYWLDPQAAETVGTMRVYQLDLSAGPLSAANLRGWGLGLIGNPAVRQTSPDRWHPRRLLVKIDDQTVYDSDQIRLDRLSLEAIRLIPPSSLDSQGQPVAHAEGPRELHLWRAGEGLGVDLQRGGVAALPPPGDPDSPATESAPLEALVGAPPADSLWGGETLAADDAAGDERTQQSPPTEEPTTDKPTPSQTPLDQPGAPGDAFAGDALGEPADGGFGAAPSGGGDLTAPGFPPSTPQGGLFPGETPAPAGGGGPTAPWSITPSPTTPTPWPATPPPGGGAITPPATTPSGPASPSGPSNPSGPGGLGSQVQPPPGTSKWSGGPASPDGEKFQISTARIVSGTKVGDNFIVTWEVSGDERDISSYDVTLRAVYPNRAAVFSQPLARQKDIRVSARKVSLELKSLPKDAHFLGAMVVGVTDDPSKKTPHHQRISPARVVIQGETNTYAKLLLDPQFEYGQPPTLLLGKESVRTQEPQATGRAVWTPDLAESHNAIEFAGARPAWNLTLRPETGEEELTARFLVPAATGDVRLIGCLGFLGKSRGVNQAEVEMTIRIIPDGATAPEQPPPETFQMKDQASGGGPEPLILIDRPLQLGAANARLELAFRLRKLTDIRYPPTLFGLRMQSSQPPPQTMLISSPPGKEKTWSLKDGILRIYGTSGHDTVEIWVADQTRIAGVWNAKTPYQKDGEPFDFTVARSQVKEIQCYVLDGHDFVSLEGDGIFLRAKGGPGNDRMRTVMSNWGHFLYGELGNDVLVGGNGDDRLEGGDGANWLNGRDGDDVLIGGKNYDAMYGGQGQDELYGGEGNDDLHSGPYQYDGATVTGTVQFGGGNPLYKYPVDKLCGDDGDDKLSADEGHGHALMLGGKGDDKLMTYFFSSVEMRGEEGDDELYGGVLDDRLDGGPGNDILCGKHGEDVLYGRDGDDFLSGGPGHFNALGGKDRLYGGAGEDLLVGHYGMDYQSGSREGLDTIYNGVYPDDSDDYLDGGPGFDRLFGEQGQDELYGGEGDDLLHGGVGDDLLLGDLGLNNPAAQLALPAATTRYGAAKATTVYTGTPATTPCTADPATTSWPAIIVVGPTRRAVIGSTAAPVSTPCREIAAMTFFAAARIRTTCSQTSATTTCSAVLPTAMGRSRWIECRATQVKTSSTSN